MYFNSSFNLEIHTSKIWLLKYQNWIIVYFYIFSKSNSYLSKKNLKLQKNNLYFYNYINNYYLNFSKMNINKRCAINLCYEKNNF
jgi:hypothetical protein